MSQPPGTFGRQAFIQNQYQPSPDGALRFSDGSSQNYINDSEGYAYELIRNADQNGDRALSFQELVQTYCKNDPAYAQAIFQGFDANGNGKLEGYEVSQFLQMADNPEAAAHFGARKQFSQPFSTARDRMSATATMNIAQAGMQSRGRTLEAQTRTDGLITAREKQTMRQLLMANPGAFRLAFSSAIQADAQALRQAFGNNAPNPYQMTDRAFSVYDRTPAFMRPSPGYPGYMQGSPRPSPTQGGGSTDMDRMMMLLSSLTQSVMDRISAPPGNPYGSAY
jgi:hypothetical protein